MMPLFTQPTPKEVKSLAFARDERQGQIPTTVEVNPKRFQVNAEDFPSLEDLTQALAHTSLVGVTYQWYLPSKTRTH